MTEPVGLKAYSLATMIQRLLGAIVNLVIYVVVGVVVFGIDMRGDLFAALVPLVLVCVALVGMGMIGACSYVYLNVRDWSNPLMWISGILVGIFSGVYFPPDILPQPIRSIGLILPQTYALEAGRLALIGGYGLAEPIIQRDIIILLLYTAIFLPTGMLAIRRAFRKLEREGFLSQW